MKPTIIPFVFIIFPIFIWSQNDFNHANQMNWLKGWTNFDPNHESYPEGEEILPNIIDGDLYLKNDIAYQLSGNVYVTNNATLTIEEGTIIRCSSDDPASLVVTKGSRLIAKGTKLRPIVFTSDKKERSRKAGDWGGIIIAGSGKVNTPSGIGIIEGNYLPQYSTYGGTEHDEVTAILSYVRIEFAGYKINQSKELNGLSLYGLGKNSFIQNIMISYSADDSFECFGGNFNMDKLISYKAKDDDYDFTNGYQGVLNNIAAIRHPYISDISGSYSIEIDGYDKKQGILDRNSLTHVKIKNATIINLSDRTNYQHTTAAISSKLLAKLDIVDSKISGFANVVKFDKTYVSANDLEQHFSLENSMFNVHSNAVLVKYESNYDASKILRYNMFTKHFKSVSDLFTNPLDEKNPKYTIKESLDNYSLKQ